MLLRPFWDRSIAVVSTWFTKYCLGCPNMHLLTQLIPVLATVSRTVGGVTDGEIVCREYVRRLRRASSSYNSKMFMDYPLCIQLHGFSEKWFDSSCSLFMQLPLHLFTHIFKRVLSSQLRKGLYAWSAFICWYGMDSCSQTRLDSGDSR